MSLTRRQIWLAALSLLLVAGLILALDHGPRYLPVSDAQRLQAVEGVSENADWEPVIRKQGGLDMALVPAGCFLMGATDNQLVEAFDSCNTYYGAFGCQQSFENEQPAHRVCLTRPFWIGLTAVTNRQYGSSSRETRMSSPSPEPSWPRETVTWQQAADYCLQRGARLPTEAEWEFAARGPDGLIYPWGNAYDIHLATLRKISPAPVGEKPEGASWVGALDLAGGMSEWVSDWYGPYPSGAEEDPGGPPSGEFRVARGGNWFAHAAFFVRTTFREPLDPAYATTTVGFRCARDFLP